jgi:hypothetical protein
MSWPASRDFLGELAVLDGEVLQMRKEHRSVRRLRAVLAVLRLGVNQLGDRREVIEVIARDERVILQAIVGKALP